MRVLAGKAGDDSRNFMFGNARIGNQRIRSAVQIEIAAALADAGKTRSKASPGRGEWNRVLFPR